MMMSQQFRARAAEFGELVKSAQHPDAVRELQRQQRTFTELANNEDWLASNLDNTVHPTSHDVVDAPILAQDRAIVLAKDSASVTEDAGYLLGCLGAAVMMQWNTLPTKLQKELFDNASSMGDLLQTDPLKAQIARFLHKHKDDEAASTT